MSVAGFFYRILQCFKAIVIGLGLKPYVTVNNRIMIKTMKDISLIKTAVQKIKGEEVKVRVSLGRNKYASYKGRLTSVYPALFTVVPDGEFNGKTSFSYAELLCGSVMIKRIKNTDKQNQ